ncbi:threonine synthase [Tissierella creatinini]|nr:threonine synthase [Tissierella creatinini]TJX64620.1 threonine synthase [Soehngenia saccharolytica]
MRYISTRDKTVSLKASQAIIQGISKDGGLFVPEAIPLVDLDKLKDLDYKALAYEIMKGFLTDFSEEDLKDCIGNAYNDKFEMPEIAPIAQVGEKFYLELYHGPTIAFKDMALSILPHLLKTAMKINGIKEEVVILTATSGDTGKAALEGFANVDKIKIVVFFPENGVSEIQKLQMKTQTGDNTFVVGINGNFDDAQNGVKKLFNDGEFVSALKNEGYILSSANSINIGRLVPQIVYYFHSYLTLLREDKLGEGEKINICVPTGNFGNILAAYYAKKMGLPVNKFICASNDNKVLTDFFTTGIYDRRRDLKLTSSPSMDILISSNLERFLFHMSGNDDGLISSIMKGLAEEGYYQFDKEKLVDFFGAYADEDEVFKTIGQVFNKYNYLLDTHTAVATSAYEKYEFEYNDDSKVIIASTASPFKFASNVAQAIGIGVRDLDEFKIVDTLAQKSGLEVPVAVSSLKDKKIIHNNKCNKEEMKNMVLDFLKVGVNND